MLAGRCPRCGGNLFFNWDFTWELECLQCGHTVKATKELRAKLPADHRRYEIVVPLSASPSECTYVKYNTIPMYAKQSYLAQERRG